MAPAATAKPPKARNWSPTKLTEPHPLPQQRKIMRKTNGRRLAACAVAGALVLSIPASQAATWSDTFLGYRYGQDFREPNNHYEIEKNILQFGYVGGDAVGQNFANLDVLQSSDKDPASGGDTGATEFYLTYRHQFYLGKTLDRDLSFGPVKEVAFTAGFALNTKNPKFAPRKRLLVAGPTLKCDVPGYLDVGLLAGKEIGRASCRERVEIS